MYFIRYHRFPIARAAKNDPPLEFSTGDSLGCGANKIWIIYRF